MNSINPVPPSPSSSNFDSKIFFVSILRNNEILVKYAQYTGNYDQLLEQVLPKIVKTNGIKMTLNYERFPFKFKSFFFIMIENLFSFII